MKRVIIESPYAGEIPQNLEYARRCMADALCREEAPFASHLLYTQPGILDDTILEERRLGIEAGLAWGRDADLVAAYVDRGISDGMRLGFDRARKRGTPIEVRALDRAVTSEDLAAVGITKEPRHLLWLDLESTGLDPEKDDILEIAYVLTEFRFPFAEVRNQRAGFTRASYLVYGRGSQDLLSGNCFPFIREMHDKSGLLAAFQNEGAKTTLETVSADLLTLAEDWPADKDEKVMIAGNSCHFDLGFLRKHLPEVAAKLSYRTFDASGFYRGCLAAGMPPLPNPVEAHRAMADVERSIELMRACVAWMRRG
jgi:oligoribonuclease (3'-5' exoribonuclease)